MQERPTSSTKRLFDLSFSLLALITSAPLWVLIAISIKFEDGGPVFYGQERVGKAGRRFKIWKFRSMTADSEHPVLQAGQNDKRVTRIGRIIRATGMDELPQLWNIFKGEMSFVGPRPLLAEEIEVSRPCEIVSIEQIPGYEARHQVTPGLTGLAQIFAPRDLARRQKFRLDILYIQKQNFLMDVRFIALSFWIVFRGKCGEPWTRRRSGVASARNAWVAPAYRHYAPTLVRIARVRPATPLNSAHLQDPGSSTVREVIAAK